MCGYGNWWLGLGHRPRRWLLRKSVPGIDKRSVDGWCSCEQGQRQDARDEKQQRSWQAAQQQQATADQPVGIVESGVLVGESGFQPRAVLAVRRLLDLGFRKPG